MKHNFKTKISRAFFVCFAITLLCSAVTVFGVALPSTYQSNLRTEQELTAQTLSRIDEALTQTDSLCVQMAYNNSTLNVLKKIYNGNTVDRAEYIYDSARMSLLYQDFLQAFSDVDGIFVYNHYGYPYYFSSVSTIDRYYNIMAEDWYKQLSSAETYNDTIISGIHTPPQLITNSKFISIYRNIRDLQNHTIIGYAEILVRPKSLRTLLNKTVSNQEGERELTLIDSTGHVICSTNGYESGDLYNEKFFSKIQGNSQTTITDRFRVVCSRSSQLSGWYLVSEFGFRTLFQDVFIIIVIFIVSFSFALILMTIWSRRIAQQVTWPLTLLSSGIADIKDKKFGQKIELNSDDEFEELAETFNQMSETLDHYILQIQEIEKQKSEAQMTALQAQINPHFTLNTINSVKNMAMLSGADNIVTMLNDFSLLLAAAFRYPNELITLREELNRIEAFSRIETVSSFGKIKFSISYEEGILDYLTLGLILQPIVENSIFHGIKPKMASHKMELGCVSIRIESSEQDILIHVVDDGIGMPQEQAEELLNGSSSGIGVNNVNTRIKLRFGENYGLSIKTAPGEGCDVLVHIPKIKK